MLFNSLEFVGFFILVYFLYRLLNHRWQNRMLLLASYWFYGSWNWKFLSLIIISTIVDFFCGRGIHGTEDPKRRKLLMSLSVTANLGMLGIFKYFNFFSDNFETLAASFGWRVDDVTLNVVLPVGISFYTFQTLSYTIDIFRRKLQPERNFINFALFVAFFPQLVAGPIERASRLLPQVRAPRRITGEGIRQGLWLICWGYFLKVLVADNLGKVVERVFATEGLSSGAEALLGVYAFAFQVFGDFAGYSNIAIGVASLMGFNLTTNFLFPYLITKPSEFWKNWHLSLSSWLRDYLYISLGGSRGGKWRTYRNLFLTMLLGGLWHGADWNSVAWGAYCGAILVVERVLHAGLPRFPLTGIAARIWFGIRVVFMFHVTCLGYLIFRSQSLGQAWHMLGRILFHLAAPSDAWAYYLGQIIFHSWLVLMVQLFQARSGDVRTVGAIPAPLRFPLLVVVIYLMVIWGEYGAHEFFYFQF